jgi:hypothetical protein
VAAALRRSPLRLACARSRLGDRGPPGVAPWQLSTCLTAPKPTVGATIAISRRDSKSARFTAHYMAEWAGPVAV